MATHTAPATTEHAVRIPCDNLMLDGDLRIPPAAQGVVLFAHGSGSGRHSARNRAVAEALNEAGLATLLLDLLTRGEEQLDLVTRALRFDIPLLANRLLAAIRWLGEQHSTHGLPIGLFGASTGAAAALIAAAAAPDAVAAVISRGGRPDLAATALPSVRAPTLLIVGGADYDVLALNRAAYAMLKSTRRMDVIPGATHLFEEPGALDQVSRLAREWFARYFGEARG